MRFTEFLNENVIYNTVLTSEKGIDSLMARIDKVKAANPSAMVALKCKQGKFSYKVTDKAKITSHLFNANIKDMKNPVSVTISESKENILGDSKDWENAMDKVRSDIKANLTPEKERRVREAIKETEALIAKEEKYQKHLQKPEKLAEYRKHLQKLQDILK